VFFRSFVLPTLLFSLSIQVVFSCFVFPPVQVPCLNWANKKKRKKQQQKRQAMNNIGGTTLSSGSPIHCLMLPVYHGIETSKGKKGHSKFCEVTAAVDAVIRQFTAQHRDAVVTMCPKRPQICCAHIAPKRRAAASSPSSVPTNAVYLYEIGCGELRRTVVAASLISIIDVVLLYCPDDEIMKELKSDDVQSHVRQYLMPLLLGMGIRRIQFVVGSDAAREVWEPTLAVCKNHSQWASRQLSVTMIVAPAPSPEGLKTTTSDDATPNPAGWVSPRVIACFTNTISEIYKSSQSRDQVAEDARRPLRISVLRRFDKIAVLVCQVLQGTLRVGDRIISVHDPLRTCTGNRVVSIRTYPLNVDVTEAFPGDQIGLLTEAQLTFQNVPKNQISQLPFLSLGQGDMLVRYGEGPQTQPCWLVVNTDVKVEEGNDLTLFGYGGDAVMRVVQRRGTSLALTHTEYTWGQGLFVDAPLHSDLEVDTPPAAVTTSQVMTNDDNTFRRVFATQTLLAATHGNGQGERVFFPVAVRAVRHRMWVHRFIVGHIVPLFDPEACGKLPADHVDVMIQKWRTALEPSPSVNDGMKSRFKDMVFDELSQLVPKDLFSTCFHAAPLSAATSETLSIGSVDGLEAAMPCMSAQMDILMLASRVPARDVAGRVWDYLASVLTSNEAPKKRQYFVTPADRGPTAAKVAAQPFSVSKVLMRCVRSTFWLRRVQRMIGDSGPSKGTNVADQWKLLELQEGSGLLTDMLGPSIRRLQVSDKPSETTKGTNIGVADRAAVLRAVLESSNGVSAATLYTALTSLCAPCVLPPRLSSASGWSDEQCVAAWRAECTAHSSFYLNSLIMAAKSPETVAHFSRWCLAAGILIPKSNDIGQQLAQSKSLPMLQRMTFVELEVLYMTQWALFRRHSVALPTSISHRIAHYLLLMEPPSPGTTA
jgi:hypothetical protein